MSKLLTRRQWGLVCGLGATALLAGAALQQQQAAQASKASALTGEGPLSTPLKTLDGRTLTAADVAGRAVVLNFWAPWCPPCVREMPLLDHFAKSSAASACVIGLAIDEQAAVEKFLTAHPVGFPIAVLGYTGLNWARQLSANANVALPFSVVYDRSGKLIQRKFGPLEEAELSAWIRA